MRIKDYPDILLVSAVLCTGVLELSREEHLNCT
jgi:hypothetical protein